VKEGKISQDLLDQRVSEALELILSTHDATANAASSFDEEGHHAVAERAAAAGIVLLKNEKAGEKPLLPLAPKTKGRPHRRLCKGAPLSGCRLLAREPDEA
jgi:beta-glucosidase